MPIKQFWKKDQISISSGDFKKLLETHNFNLMDYEVDELIQEFSNEEGKIELTKLCKGVELWKNHTQG